MVQKHIIPYARQSISEEDIQSVVNTLRSAWLTQGPTLERFEQEMAARCGAHHAIAVCNATAALHLACLTLGLSTGDYLWTSSNTFVASANCALYCGAEVDFVDIDPKTYNLCPKALAKKLKEAKSIGKLPKIVIPVHFAGQPCDMKAIKALADEYHFFIIEDAAHAIGASYLDTQVGSCRYADLTIFSFHPVKIMTTGEGGMILTNQSHWQTRLKLLRAHGVTRDVSMMTSPSEGDWYYQQIALGFNYRMTDIQAALGLSQLEQLDHFLKRRRYLVERYRTLLQGLPLILPYEHKRGLSAWHLYVIQLQNRALRNNVFTYLRQKDIQVNIHYIPVHLHPFYQTLGFKVGDYPLAEDYYARALSLPLYYGLSDKEQDYIIKKLRSALTLQKKTMGV